MMLTPVTGNRKPSANRARKAPERKLEAAAVKDSVETGGYRTLKLSYLPQDPGMIPAQLGEVQADDSLRNERFQLSVGTGYPTIKPDAEGKIEINDLEDPRFDSSNCFYIANQTLATAEKYANRRIDWSFEKTLGHPMLIRPHAGKEVVNAYYNNESGSVNFFSYLDEKTGLRQRTGMSRDVIAHEIGHAILDGMRPNLLGSLSVGAGGFHESFGDMTAFLSSLNDPAVVEALRVETKGDLSKPNLLSGMGEQLGSASYEKGPLRDFINTNKYADQAFLPYSDDNDPASGLGTECHAYANLFNGAFYDLFLNFYNQASAQPESTFQSAVAEARDKVGQLLLRGIEMGPVGDISYREAAMAFLRADLVDNDGASQETIEKVFTDRNILRPGDADSVRQAQQNLPDLKWSSELNDAEGGNAWLEANRDQLGLPEGVPLEYERVCTTNRGERFVTFTTHRDRLLEGSGFGDYEGSQIRSGGGVMLGFDKSGKLETFEYDEVSDRELEDTESFFRGNLEMKQVMKATGEVQSLNKKTPPKLQIESVMEDGHRVLRRSGMI